MKENWWEGLTRVGMRPGLERTLELLDRLGNPQLRYPIIHIAGTNGKGSTAALVTEALISQGYRVGLTTSPDLGQINERVMINRIPLDPAEWDRLGALVEQAGRQLAEIPTFFEAVTALAFLAFDIHQVDVAVVEVGLGGRLDATNVIPVPMLSIITPIAFDHMDRLGNTISAIAGEKAGIIKPGTRLVLARQPYREARIVAVEAARRLGVEITEPLHFGELDDRGVWWNDPEAGEMRVPLLGAYQIENVATARAAVSVLHELGWVRDWSQFRRAWAAVQWPGRFQVVHQDPLWIIDGAHNPHGVEALINTLRRSPWDRYRWHLIFGVLADKPGEAMLERLLPFVSEVILTRVPTERGADPKNLYARFACKLPIKVVEDPVQAASEMRSQAMDGGDAVLICGSLALLSYLNQQEVFLVKMQTSSNIVEQ